MDREFDEELSTHLELLTDEYRRRGLFGAVPTWRATGVELTAPLRSGHGNTASKMTRRLGLCLVAGQVALSVLLLVGAGLFVQTLRNLARLDVGFDPDTVLQVSLDRGYYAAQKPDAFRNPLVGRLSAIPGVRSISGSDIPLMGELSLCRLPTPAVSTDRAVSFLEVGPSFFESLGIPVLQGRSFTGTDVVHQRALLVVSEAFARRHFSNEDAIGKPLSVVVRNQPRWYEIAGIARDVRLGSLRGESGPMIYAVASRTVAALQIRTAAGTTDAVAAAVVEEIQRINPRMLLDIRTLRQAIDRSIETERLAAATSATFGLICLLLVAIGIFGVAAYTVAQRTNELGIRMALGASRWRLIRESLQETTAFFGAGVTVGLVAAGVAVRFTSAITADLLYGLTAGDATNMTAVVLLMMTVAGTACVVPAIRATRIDPMTAIRSE